MEKLSHLGETRDAEGVVGPVQVRTVRWQVSLWPR